MKKQTASEEMTMTIDELIQGHAVSDHRRETLTIAIQLGASDDVLVALRNAVRVARRDTITLPPNRLEGLSRGRGWCRQGRGDKVTWGSRERDGYVVGPGRWAVGATDGFARRKSTDYDVEHVQVGDQIWTIAT